MINHTVDNLHAIPRYPLEWPLGWTRTLGRNRQRAAFTHYKQAMTVASATARLQQQLDLLGIARDGVVLSSNLSLRLDGLPRSATAEPVDPGVSLWFKYKKIQTVLACDKWNRVADNIAALAAHIDAIRRVDRYGVGSIEQALGGYKALPADTAADWRAVFGFGTAEYVGNVLLDERFKQLARERHPDITHDDGAAMAHLNRARDYAMAELSGQ